MFSLRWYQTEAIDALFRYFEAGHQGNPVVVCPTGAGKGLLIAEFIRRAVTSYPGTRIINAIHTQELVRQNELECHAHFPLAETGVYSASLGRRNISRPITFCSIQSVYAKAAAFGRVDLLLVDEAHMVPRKSEAMYGQFIEGLKRANPYLRVIGFTATPYRMDSGGLVGGEGAIFTDIVYDVPLAQLVREGFLSPLISKRPKTTYDLSGVKTSRGDYVTAELDRAVNTDDLNSAAVAEMLEYGRDRQSWLVFCVTVDHANRVATLIRAAGISVEVVEGEMPKDRRARVIEAFKRKEIRCLVSVNVLLIGFNAPAVDLIAMMRSTKSTGLYVQCLGRGLRKAAGKTDCLVLDYGLNIMTHGPVDCIPTMPGRKKKAAGDAEALAPAKTCPECESMVHPSVLICPDCGHQWPPREPAVEPEAETEAVMATVGHAVEANPWMPVVGFSYFLHDPKDGRPVSMRAEYIVQRSERHRVEAREWVCFQHSGVARDRAMAWWVKAGGKMPFPGTVDGALDRQDELKQPTHAILERNGKFWNIKQLGYFEAAADQEDAA
jgi:DNA repair protein RadD